MPNQLLASLTTKAAIGVAAATLAAGSSGAVLVTQAINDDAPATSRQTTEAEVAKTTSGAEKAAERAAKAAAHDAKGDDAELEVPGTTATPDSKEHPDNFGAVVSADAQDGGVDGQEIAAAAHARNEARRAAREAAATPAVTPDDATDDGEKNDDTDGPGRSDAGKAHAPAKPEK